MSDKYIVLGILPVIPGQPEEAHSIVIPGANIKVAVCWPDSVDNSTVVSKKVADDTVNILSRRNPECTYKAVQVYY
jgi:hypothetical protein